MKQWLFAVVALLLVMMVRPLWSQTASADTSAGTLSQFWHMISSPQGQRELIEWGGYLILFAIVFAETGLLIGFFLPGDSLLVIAGIVAATGLLDIALLNLLLIPAAIIGDAVGYSIGYRSGSRLLNRPNSRLFKKEHLEKTQAFYAKHGNKTIVLARFVPLVRTFAPVVAGLARMPYRQFAVFNILGGLLWIASTTLLGYFLGNQIPDIDKYIHYVIGIVIFLSILPIVYQFIKARMNRRTAVEEASRSK
jgi:membrane-associated protein